MSNLIHFFPTQFVIAANTQNQYGTYRLRNYCTSLIILISMTTFRLVRCNPGCLYFCLSNHVPFLNDKHFKILCRRRTNHQANYLYFLSVGNSSSYSPPAERDPASYHYECKILMWLVKVNTTIIEINKKIREGHTCFCPPL